MKVKEALNIAWYLWKRNTWILAPWAYWGRFEEVPIDRPIFLLGVQGGGLTLLTRMLRRHPEVVSVTGNHRYWSVADEMHTVFGPILPPELTGTRYKVPWPDHPLYKPPRSWTYACDELLPYYRKTAEDANAQIKNRLVHVIQYCIARHAPNKTAARFIDKSQVYTVRVSLIAKLLEEYDPKFILVTTNPYSVCYKAASGYAQDMKRLVKKLSFAERLEVCAQHWANSMKCALEDRTNNMLIIKFRDILTEPVGTLKRICEHIGLKFDPRMIPRPEDKLPFRSKYRTRWYPLQPDRAFHYIEKARPEGIEIIHHYCGDVAKELGYMKPKKR